MRAGWLVLSVVLSACGEEHSGSIDDIPQGTRISELTDSEIETVCNWQNGLADRTFAHAKCGNVTLSNNAADCMSQSTSSECDVTLAELKACMPALFQHIADDLCKFIDVAQSGDLSEVMAYVAETPHCENAGACVTLR